jgi:hypothetical protein
MSAAKNPRCTNVQCNKMKRFINGEWQCPHCSPCAKTIEMINRRIANGYGYRNVASDKNKVRRTHIEPVKPTKSWRPKWANSKHWHSKVGVSLQMLVESVRLGREPYIKGAKL